MGCGYHFNMSLRETPSVVPFPLAALRRAVLFVVVALLVIAHPQTASASATFEVPESGLSFDANDSEPADPCTTGFGNASLDTDLSDSEISFVQATEKVFYKNIANIGGQAINGMVTVTSISGMETQNFGSGDVQTLSRLDKCDLDDQGLVELRFASATGTPGEANFVITIDFYLSGGTLAAPGTVATLTNLKMNVEDIDSNQFLEVDGFSSVRLAEGRDSTDVQEYLNAQVIDVGGANSAALSMSGTARRYHALGSSSSSDPVAEKDKHVVEVTYGSVSSIVMKLGAYESGSGSFDLDFRGFTFASDNHSDSSASSPSSNTATHLDMQGRVGQQGASAPVLMEGQGLLPGSAYSLTLREPEQVIQSGTANTGGRFSHFVYLPADLQPGSYTIALSAIGINGESLVLTQSFRIGSDGKFSQIDTTVPTVNVGSGPAGVPVANEELPSTGVRSSSLPWWAIITIFGGLMLILYSRRAVKMAEAFDARLDENGHRTPWEILSTPIRVPGIDYSPGALGAAGSSQSLGEAVRGLDVALSLILASQIARLRTHA